MVMIPCKKFRVPLPDGRQYMKFILNVDRMMKQQRNLTLNIKMHEPLLYDRFIREDTSNNYDEFSTSHKGDYWWNFN